MPTCRAGRRICLTAQRPIVRTQQRIPLPIRRQTRRQTQRLIHPAIRSQLHCQAPFRTPCPVLHRIPFQIRPTQHQWIQLLIQRQTLRLVQRLILVQNPTLVVIAEEMDRRTPVAEAMAVAAEEAMAEEEEVVVVVVKEVAAVVVAGTETNLVSYEE